MESLKPGQSGRAQDPCLAAEQEDGLHDHLIEFGADARELVLLPHLHAAARTSWVSPYLLDHNKF